MVLVLVLWMVSQVKSWFQGANDQHCCVMQIAPRPLQDEFVRGRMLPVRVGWTSRCSAPDCIDVRSISS